MIDTYGSGGANRSHVRTNQIDLSAYRNFGSRGVHEVAAFWDAVASFAVGRGVDMEMNG